MCHKTVTITVRVPLEVTFGYCYSPAEPSVGLPEGAEDIVVKEIAGILPQLFVNEGKTRYLVDDHVLKNEGFDLELFIGPDLEKLIMDEAKDSIAEHAAEEAGEEAASAEEYRAEMREDR